MDCESNVKSFNNTLKINEDIIKGIENMLKQFRNQYNKEKRDLQSLRDILLIQENSFFYENIGNRRTRVYW